MKMSAIINHPLILELRISRDIWDIESRIREVIIVEWASEYSREKRSRACPSSGENRNLNYSPKRNTGEEYSWKRSCRIRIELRVCIQRRANYMVLQAINQQLADTGVCMYRYYIDSAVSTGFLVDSSSANNQNPQLSRAVFSSLCSGNVQIFARWNNSKSHILCIDNKIN